VLIRIVSYCVIEFNKYKDVRWFFIIIKRVEIIITLSRQQETNRPWIIGNMPEHHSNLGPYFRGEMLKAGEWIDKTHEIADALEHEAKLQCSKEVERATADRDGYI